MKNSNPSKASIISILLFIFSCQTVGEAPQPSFDVKSLMKETIKFSYDINNYTFTNENELVFNSEKYEKEITRLYPFLKNTDFNSKNIQSETSDYLSDSYNSEDFHSDVFLNYVQEIQELAADIEVNQEKIYFEKLEDIVVEISKSSIDIEEKNTLYNVIQFSYIAYIAIDELSREGLNIDANRSVLPTQIADDCKFDWNDVLETALTDTAWGALIGAIGGGLTGGAVGTFFSFGLATPLSAALGAYAGANMAAAADFIEGFARGTVNNAIKYLLCKHA